MNIKLSYLKKHLGNRELIFWIRYMMISIIYNGNDSVIKEEAEENLHST